MLSTKYTPLPQNSLWPVTNVPWSPRLGGETTSTLRAEYFLGLNRGGVLIAFQTFSLLFNSATATFTENN